MNDTSRTTIVDPIYGYVDIEADEQRLVSHRIFQRLRFIKQLPFANVAYPSANQTRYEHAIGTMHIASRIISEIDRRPSVVKTMRIAALLHDIGHGPFGHVFETLLRERHGYEFERPYDSLRRRIILETEIRDILNAAGCSPDEITKIFDARENNPILSDIISSPIDADRIDYILRDSYHAGLPRVIDLEALVRSCVKSRNNLVHRIGALNALEDFLLNRYRLSTSLYFHKDVRSAEIMMLEAVRAADDELHLSESVRNLGDFLELTDSSLMTHLLDLAPTSPAVKRATDLARRVVRNELLPVAFETNLAPRTSRSRDLDEFLDALVVRPHTAVSREMSERISSLAGVHPEQVFVDLLVLEMHENIPLETNEKEIRFLDEVSTTSRQMFPINYLRIYTYPNFVRRVAEVSSRLFSPQ